MRELHGLTALTELDLRFCPVTDDWLQHLTCLSALTSLYLSDNSTTEVGRDALETALPALTIDWWY